MSASIPYGDIRAWIDDSLVETVEQVPDSNADYNFQVELSGMPIHVASPLDSDGLLIAGQAIPAGEVKETFTELSQQDLDRLQARLEETLNNSRGIYRYQTEGGQDCEFKDLHHVRIEHRIYPDGATQHELMTSILDVIKSLNFIQNSIATLTKNVQNTT